MDIKDIKERLNDISLDWDTGNILVARNELKILISKIETTMSGKE